MNKKEYRGKRSVLYFLAISNFIGYVGLLYIIHFFIAKALSRKFYYYILFLFWVGVVIIFWYVLHIILKGCYIRVTDEGIYISSCIFTPAKDINWEAISKIKKIYRKNQAITLSRWYEKDITIRLGILTKDDQNNLIEIIKAKIENKIDVEDK